MASGAVQLIGFADEIESKPNDQPIEVEQPEFIDNEEARTLDPKYVISPDELAELRTQREYKPKKDFDEWFEGQDDFDDESLLQKLKKPQILGVAVSLGFAVFLIGKGLMGSSGAPLTEDVIQSRMPSIEDASVDNEMPRLDDLRYQLDKANRRAEKLKIAAYIQSQPKQAGKPEPQSHLKDEKRDLRHELIVQNGVKRQQASRSRRKRTKRASGTAPERLRRGERRADVSKSDAQTLVSSVEAPKPIDPMERPWGPEFYRSTKWKKKSSKTKQSLELVPGTRFRAKLTVGLSTAVSGMDALAQVVEPVLGEDRKVLVPEGSLLQGRYRGAINRIYIQFHTVMIGKEKYGIKGIAVQESKPGLRAIVHQTTQKPDTEARAGSVAARGALRTAQGLVSSIPGANLGQRLVGNIASEGVSEINRGSAGGFGMGMTQVVMELEAGVMFQVILN